MLRQRTIGYSADNETEILDRAARQLQRISMKIIRVLVGTGNFFAAMKVVLEMQGLELGTVRSPLQNPNASVFSSLQDDLAQLGFWDMCNTGSKSANSIALQNA